MSTEMTTRGYLTAALVPLGEQWKKMRRILTTKVVSQAKHQWFYAKRTEEADHLAMKKVVEIVDKYHNPIIEERIRQCRIGFKKEIEDLLDVFITLKDGASNPLLSTNEINAQIREIMIATVDNPSNAVEWAIAEMINQPEILEKAIEELDRVVGKERLVQESNFSQGFTWTAPPNETKIDLSKAEDSLALAKPLIVVTKPRLAEHVYRNL
ncbi:hypothetical protein Q3G72_034106 [Acer saccharum]|nr:hypothetical protein Q3G72_034106 [Acer saccharum]